MYKIFDSEGNQCHGTWQYLDDALSALTFCTDDCAIYTLIGNSYVLFNHLEKF